jgi:hypothetical protein
MKKSTTYSFWIVTSLFVGGLFFGWANYFQPSSLAEDGTKKVAIQREQSAPVIIPWRNTPSVQSTQTVTPNTTQNTQATTPTSIRKTKTS